MGCSKVVAVIDPSSYSLPYDYFYLNELGRTHHVDFYYSKTPSNYEYINKLKENSNITLYEYNISPSCTSKLIGIINYSKLLLDIYSRREKYKKIHFIWSIFLFFEFFLFLAIKNKLVFTFHNDVPHSYRKKTYKPYSFISKLASKVVFVSNYTMEKFIKNYGKHKDTHLIQHGIMPIDVECKKVDVQPEKAILFWGRVEKYKGVDVFAKFNFDEQVEIFGRWSGELLPLKCELEKNSNIYINDSYLSFEELSVMLSREAVFILPYRDATQSGVLYTLLAYGKVFISSDVGENSAFLLKYGLEKLIFDRNDKESIVQAIDYAFNHYTELKLKLLRIKEAYKWDKVMDEKTINALYK